MLEITKLRTEAEDIILRLEKKYVAHARETVMALLTLDEKRRQTIVDLEALRQEMNTTAKSIGQLMKAGKREEAEAAKTRSAEAKAAIKSLEATLQEIEAETHERLVTLPNTPDPSVPVGRDAAANTVVYQNDVKVSFDFVAQPHWELARTHDIIDWELGVKLTGAGFPVYKGKGAILQRALIAFFLREANAAGYTEIQPPLMVNEASGFGTGQLPDKDGQMYAVERDGFYLIPTAEVPITNLYRDTIIEQADLPIRNCGYTPCFRREAGSYGKDVKGLNRLHQFDKVELVQITQPEHSYETLEAMVTYVEGLLTQLELPYRRLLLCTGDTSFTSAKTYDLEVYSAAQERWLEVSSVSNFETYQTNRLKLRYRDEDRKIRLAHSLNGSALALPRILAALLENNQQADGSIRIPEVLQAFTGFDRIGGA
ncbi:MAG: serine--tRNA ligase [Bacteroidetes bacterium]|nr:MAG: serine--tRNA ligase [Bacteroidota bacterium]